MISKKEQSQLLALLVMDLGYTSEPVYGHHPMRHQFAWEMAVDGLTESEVAEAINNMLEIRSKEQTEVSLCPPCPDCGHRHRASACICGCQNKEWRD